MIEFGRLEYLIKLCVKDLAGQGFGEGMVMAESKRQFETLCKDVKKRGAEVLEQAQAENLAILINQALALAEYRNDTVHAFWTVDQGQPLRVRPKLEKATRAVNWDRGRPVSLEELQSKAHEIRELRRGLHAEKKEWSLPTANS